MIHDDTIVITVQGSRKQTTETSSKSGSVWTCVSILLPGEVVAGWTIL